MVGKPAPINTDVLDWAIRESGLSETELSARAKISEDRLHQILIEHTPPMTGEFKAIAKALSRPTAFFFLQKPPKKSPVATAFRYPPGRDKRHPLTFSEQNALRGAQRWQKVVSWLRTQDGEPGCHLPVAKHDDANNLAAAMQSWTAWDFKEQRKATSASAVLKSLRLRIEDQGVLVLQFSLGKESCRGFSLPSLDTPVIALNSTYNPQARLFTLMHEVAHLLRGDQAVCGDPKNDHVERLCEKASAAFLMPRLELIDYVDKWLKVSRVDDVDQVRRTANYFRVSLRAAAIRLVEVNRGTPDLYDKVETSGFAEFGGIGFNPNAERQTTSVIRLRELGSGITRSLVSAQQTGALSEVEVRRYLDVNGSQLGEIKSLLSNRSAIEV